MRRPHRASTVRSRFRISALNVLGKVVVRSTQYHNLRKRLDDGEIYMPVNAECTTSDSRDQKGSQPTDNADYRGFQNTDNLLPWLPVLHIIDDEFPRSCSRFNSNPDTTNGATPVAVLAKPEPDSQSKEPTDAAGAVQFSTSHSLQPRESISAPPVDQTKQVCQPEPESRSDSANSKTNTPVDVLWDQLLYLSEHRLVSDMGNSQMRERWRNAKFAILIKGKEAAEYLIRRLASSNTFHAQLAAQLLLDLETMAIMQKERSKRSISVKTSEHMSPLTLAIGSPVGSR